MIDQGNVERLAIAQAVFKAVSAAVSTKDPLSLRGRLDEELRDMYADVGVKSIDVKVAGQKVGTYSVKVAKAKDEMRVRVTDHRAFEEWLFEGDGTGYLHRLVGECEDRLVRMMSEAGEVAPGCDAERHSVPDMITGTTLTVRPDKVAEALDGQLTEAIAMLLPSRSGEVG